MLEANRKPDLKVGQAAQRLPRLGVETIPNDPYWVQVREAVYRGIAQCGAELVPLEIVGSLQATATLDSQALAEEFLAQALDALICVDLPPGVVEHLLANQLPVIQLAEAEETQHRLFTSPCGLYECARLAGEYIARRLGGRGRTLCVGGLLDVGSDKGKSRIQGYADAVRPFPDISVLHCPTYWDYTRAYPQIEAALRTWGPPIDAIFGISDPLALAAWDAGRATHILDPHTLIVGINGDPEALVAIAKGSLAGTVDTSASTLGRRAVELAMQAARGQPLPPHYSYQFRLHTADNMADVAVEKLAAMVSILDSLVGVNRQHEQRRLAQLETSMAINHRVGAILDRHQLSQALADPIRINYGYDQSQLFLWEEAEQMLVREDDGVGGSRTRLPLAEAGLLGQVIQQNEPILIPDYRYSSRFSPDPAWPETRGRVILPIRLGDKVMGVLDLHSRQPIQQLHCELMGLQSLADQIGVAMRNAQLYAAALQARTQAEKADQLKTRLLANVSHELREPLNIILGYTKAAITEPNPYHKELPAELRQDLEHVFCSAEHLIRLINDLLDLSRAEIGELDLFPETIPTRSFLEQVFHSLADSCDANPNVSWELCVPERLPMIRADPVRLRQILLNLLSNARKFTVAGRVTLGARVDPPHLHLWVQDTGPGIPVEQRELIFQPFVTVERHERRQEGIGLGLSIVRRLVALHGGTITLDSSPEEGSTFNIYLPLPSLSGQMSLQSAPDGRRELLLLSANPQPPQELIELSQRGGWTIRCLSSHDHLETVLKETPPVLLAWDLTDAGRDDWALVQWLQSHPTACRLPLIIYSREDPKVSAWPVGLTDVITKPVNGQTLLETLQVLAPAGFTGSIWVVDDDPRARELYTRLAAQALPGHPIREIPTGAVALERMAGETPGLVILDLMMPEVDGFAVLERLRTDPRTRSVPVLVMSGKVLSMDDIRRLDYANVMLQKKELLGEDEVIACLQRVFHGAAELPQPTSALVKRALVYIYQNYGHPLSRQEIAGAVGVSVSYLSHIFHHEVGFSPWEWLTRFRIERAKELLSGTNLSITEVASQVGFEDSAYFSRVFRKSVGQSSQAYRKQAQQTSPPT